MEWYKEYEGIPFEHLGESIETGIDCFNLFKHIYKVKRNIDFPVSSKDIIPKELGDKWYQKTHVSPFDFLNQSCFGWEKVTNPIVFDILVFTYGSTNCANHCAMYVDSNKILQIMENRKSWVGKYGTTLKHCNMGRIYRWNKNLVNLKMVWECIHKQNTLWKLVV